MNKNKGKNYSLDMFADKQWVSESLNIRSLATTDNLEEAKKTAQDFQFSANLANRLKEGEYYAIRDRTGKIVFDCKDIPNPFKTVYISINKVKDFILSEVDHLSNKGEMLLFAQQLAVIAIALENSASKLGEDEPQIAIVCFDKNGAPRSNSSKEQTRLDKRTEIVIRVLKQMGHDDASPETYNKIIEGMTKDGLSKEYTDMIKIVHEISQKEGC
jgi:hypothetical protein